MHVCGCADACVWMCGCMCVDVRMHVCGCADACVWMCGCMCVDVHVPGYLNLCYQHSHVEYL